MAIFRLVYTLRHRMSSSLSATTHSPAFPGLPLTSPYTALQTVDLQSDQSGNSPALKDRIASISRLCRHDRGRGYDHTPDHSHDARTLGHTLDHRDDHSHGHIHDHDHGLGNDLDRTLLHPPSKASNLPAAENLKWPGSLSLCASFEHPKSKGQSYGDGLSLPSNSTRKAFNPRYDHQADQ